MSRLSEKDRLIRQRAKHVRYTHSPKGRSSRQRYERGAKAHARNLRYKHSAKGRAVYQAYERTLKGIRRHLRYREPFGLLSLQTGAL